MSYISIENLDDEKRMVKKSNDLVRSYYDLSLTEMRIISIAISYIKDIECMTVDIPLPSYKKHLKIKNVNYSHFEEVLKSLRQNTIVMAKMDKNTGDVSEGLVTGWVNRIQLKNNYVSIAFNSDVWEHLINRKKDFTLMQLSSVLDLKSKHSFRLHEILKSYAWTGEYLVKVSELRALLFLEDKYKLYADFNKKILEPSVKEINESEYKEIEVSFVPVKNGARYDYIKFTISKVIVEKDSEDEFIPPEVQMARNMSVVELFTSIKTLLLVKHKVMFNVSDSEWQEANLYTKYALESTYLSLLEDEWKDHKITSYKSFFAEHLKRLSKTD